MKNATTPRSVREKEIIMQKQKRNGFSRSEFLALGAVVSIAVLCYCRVLAQRRHSNLLRQHSAPIAALTIFKQVSLASRNIQDYDERYPSAVSDIGSPNGASPYGWADALQPYIRNMRIFQCPSERHRGQDNPDLRVIPINGITPISKR